MLTSFKDLFLILKRWCKSNGWERGWSPIGLEEQRLKVRKRRYIVNRDEEIKDKRGKRKTRVWWKRKQRWRKFGTGTFHCVIVFMLRGLYPIFSVVRRDNLYSKTRTTCAKRTKLIVIRMLLTVVINTPIILVLYVH